MRLIKLTRDMVKKIFTLALLSLLLVVTWNYNSSINEGYIVKYHQEKPIFSTEYWEKKIRILGMHQAYTFLADMVKGMDDYGRHLNAHQFGDALFKSKGFDGIPVCDNNFGQGCFHQLFMTGLRLLGPGLALQLEQACLEKLGEGSYACTHGIGHGIMAAYDWTDLDSALDTCYSFQNKKASYGCDDGVFMEYFTPTHLVAKGKASARKLDRENPRSACLDLDPRHQPSCYAMSVGWWLMDGVSAKDSGEWCRTIEEKNNYEACFKALGYSLVLASKYTKGIVLEKCEGASINTTEIVLCRAGAFFGFSKGEALGEILKEEDKALCDFGEKELCLREAALVTEIGLGISALCCPPIESL